MNRPELDALIDKIGALIDEGTASKDSAIGAGLYPVNAQIMTPILPEHPAPWEPQIIANPAVLHDDSRWTLRGDTP